MMKKRVFFVCLCLLLTLSACSDDTGENTSTPKPAPTPTVPVETPLPAPTPDAADPEPVNPLTGEPMDKEQVKARPVAVMLNNLKQALPQQGQSQADIIYEVLTEGGITRMLGIYQNVEDVGEIGSVRSARACYVELALGHDAVFIHAGGSEEAYAKLKEWDVTHLDGVRGPYMSDQNEGNLMWRDPDRRRTMSLEHTVVTSGEMISEKFPKYSFRKEHEEGYTYEMAFAEDGTPDGGRTADSIRVSYSSYKPNGTFTYDSDTKLYLVGEYGKPYVDGNTGEQVGVTNVVVLFTTCKNTGDSYGHVDIDLSSGGTGYFACGGKLIDITWTKAYPDGQLKYFDEDGEPVVFGIGKTYVNIVPTGSSVRLNETE